MAKKVSFHATNFHLPRNPKHAEWVNSYVATFDAMQSYVKEYHTTGLVWNPRVCHSYLRILFSSYPQIPQGITIDQYKASSTTSGASGPPPPPPPPPPLSVPANTAPPAGGAAAVFAQLNRGEEVTKGLRKVDKSEMTHKNPALRASSVVPARAVSPSPGQPLPRCRYRFNIDISCLQSVKSQPSPRNHKPLQARNLPSFYWTVVSGL